MKNDNVLIEYHREKLEKAIEKFFLQNQIDNTAQLLNDLSFYATNDKASREIDLKQTRDLLNESIALLSDLTILYTSYSDYQRNSNPKN